MRKRIVAGNWKMNLDRAKAHSLFNELKEKEGIFDNETEVIIAPPAIYLNEFANSGKTKISIAAQNCSAVNDGARTGEISASMLASISVNYCLVGHSERRQFHFETDDIIKEKVNRLLENNIVPIFCCGENLSERQENKHFTVIEQQIKSSLYHLSQIDIQKVVIAYEPVWAIGTGVTATAEQAQEIHAFIRKLLSEQYSQDIAENISILYGGSCKPENAKELFSNYDVDGGLIGGAALNADNFTAIINGF